MKKNRLIIIGLIFFIIFILLIINIFLSAQNAKQPNQTVIHPTTVPTKAVFDPNMPTPTIIIPTGTRLQIGGVFMQNFYNNADNISYGEVNIIENNTFHITYSPQNQSFLINILESPFETVRSQAEQAFLYKLGIDRQEACKLKVTIATPIFANPDFAGETFPLSFCR